MKKIVLLEKKLHDLEDQGILALDINKAQATSTSSLD